MYKIVDHVGWRHLNEDQILVMDCHTTYAYLISHVSVLIWKNLESSSVEEIVDIVLEEYDINKNIAQNDIREFINSLESKKLIQ